MTDDDGKPDGATWYRLELRIKVDPKKIPDREDASEKFIDLFDSIARRKVRAAGIEDTTSPEALPDDR